MYIYTHKYPCMIVNMKHSVIHNNCVYVYLSIYVYMYVCMYANMKHNAIHNNCIHI